MNNQGKQILSLLFRDIPNLKSIKLRGSFTSLPLLGTRPVVLLVSVNSISLPFREMPAVNLKPILQEEINDDLKSFFVESELTTKDLFLLLDILARLHPKFGNMHKEENKLFEFNRKEFLTEGTM